MSQWNQHLHKFRWQMNCRFMILRILLVFLFLHFIAIFLKQVETFSILFSKKLSQNYKNKLTKSIGLGWKTHTLVHHISTWRCKKSMIQTLSLGYWPILHCRLHLPDTLFQSFWLSHTPYKTVLPQNSYMAELRLLSVHTHPPEIARGFQFKRNSIIGSNSTKSFPGHQIAGKHPARNKSWLKISNNANFMDLFLFAKAIILPWFRPHPNNPFVLNLQLCRKLTVKRKNYLSEHLFSIKGFTRIKNLSHQVRYLPLSSS